MDSKLHIAPTDEDRLYCGRAFYGGFRYVSYRTADSIVGGHDPRGRDYVELCFTCRKAAGLLVKADKRTAC